MNGNSRNPPPFNIKLTEDKSNMADGRRLVLFAERSHPATELY